jgi:CRISPR-associated protein (TIGR03984 family)
MSPHDPPVDVELRTWTGVVDADLSLTEVLIACGVSQTIAGYVYTPNNAWMIVYDVRTGIAVGGPNDEGQDKINLGAAFEMKLFNAHFELRWFRRGREADIAILSDNQIFQVQKGAYGLAQQNTRKMERIDNHYVLWGKSTGLFSNGWTQLASRRIGKIWAPTELAPQENCVRVAGFEYFEVEPDYGNLVPAGERFTGFSGFTISSD